MEVFLRSKIIILVMSFANVEKLNDTKRILDPNFKVVTSLYLGLNSRFKIPQDYPCNSCLEKFLFFKKIETVKIYLKDVGDEKRKWFYSKAPDVAKSSL